MGPTAAGKTGVALSLARRFPVSVISVDSAMVYRGMDIGTAKPDAATLARVPHRLVDIRDPTDSYSAGEFVADARRAINDSAAAGRVPLLVGGTMMYFRALTEGLAELPAADPAIRSEIDAQAGREGWPAMHGRLAAVDPASAAKIEPNDRQRIQRALEVFRLSGEPLSAWQSKSAPPDAEIRYLKLALDIEPRAKLHERIAVRLGNMFDAGLVDEVRGLMRQGGLTAEHPSMRAVGYRQVWAHLAGGSSLDDARARALASTRQLAKRQLTWLRGDPGIARFDALESDVAGAISGKLAAWLR